ncbi:MAG: PilZ domain-containing protein [Deltaproteobacteria bacterium]|nr:PilZ domain-containing protein [Deltaproteobacteria bacterium]
MDFRLGQHSSHQNRSQQEKRSDERYDLELPVTIKWKNRSGQTIETTGKTKNMSPSGTFIICGSPIAEGLVIDLHIDIPVALGGSILSCISANGTIVRSGKELGSAAGYGHGIMFDHFSFKRL